MSRMFLDASLEYALFPIEIPDFFEFGRIDELLNTIGCMYAGVCGTSSRITPLSNTGIFQCTIGSILQITVKACLMLSDRSSHP